MRALGPELFARLASALEQSRTVQTGILTDLEGTILLIEGIAAHLVADITTNVIRGPLVVYRQQACAVLGIPLELEGQDHRPVLERVEVDVVIDAGRPGPRSWRRQLALPCLSGCE